MTANPMLHKALRSTGFTPLEAAKNAYLQDKGSMFCDGGKSPPSNRRNRFRSLTGFTLAELLITIVVLSILAAVALPRYFPQREKTRVAEAIRILSAIREGEEVYYAQYGNYLISIGTGVDQVTTDKWGQLGIANPNVSTVTGTTFFTYYVTSLFGGTGTSYMAVAQRKPSVPPGSRYDNTTIILNQSGTYSGTHPFRPN